MSESAWPRLNRERGLLIDKKIAGTITAEESLRLEYLTGYADAYLFSFKRVDRLERENCDIALPLMVCARCGGIAEWKDDEQAWRHAGSPMKDGYLEQSFCEKYGYPIEVRRKSNVQSAERRPAADARGGAK